jgi:hypothetical protein
MKEGGRVDSALSVPVRAPGRPSARRGSRAAPWPDKTILILCRADRPAPEREGAGFEGSSETALASPRAIASDRAHGCEPTVHCQVVKRKISGGTGARRGVAVRD